MVDRMSELFGYESNDNLIPKKGSKSNNQTIKSMTNNIVSSNKKVGISAKELSKSDKARSEGKVEKLKYRNYYDINNTITVALAVNPNDEDHSDYNRERVFESLERNAEILYVANDGIDTLFVIASHQGGQNFARERPIYPGDVKEFYNIYELRLRSSTVGLPYRVTEYEIDTFPIAYLTTQPLNIRPLNCEDRVSICAPYGPVLNYNITQGLGAGSSGIYNYIATGNFKLSSVEVSSAGALKIEIKAGDIGFESMKMVAFTTETNLTAQLRFFEELQLIAGQRLQIIITNRELQSTDVYSTIMGFNS